MKKKTDQIKKEDPLQKFIKLYIQKTTGEKKNQDSPEMSQQIAKLRTLSEKYKVSPVNIALQYVLRFSNNFYPVLGTSNPNHLEESLQALEVNLSAEDFADLSP